MTKLTFKQKQKLWADTATELFEQMINTNVKFNADTFVAIVKDSKRVIPPLVLARMTPVLFIKYRTDNKIKKLKTFVRSQRHGRQSAILPLWGRVEDDNK